MSGAIIHIPDSGEAWDNAWEASEYGRKGKMSLSLTGYDTASAPLVADGSWTEVAGSIYKFTADDSVSGSAATGIAYIKMVPSGTSTEAIITPTWTATAPTWSDSYQGYYIGTHRVVVGCDFDGTNYDEKWIYKRPEDHYYTRTSGSLRPLKTKTIEIGDWNMDTTTAVNVAHGLGSAWQGVKTISVIIRHDSDTPYYDLQYTGTTDSGNAGAAIDATNVILTRVTGGEFDGSAFDSTSYNRGWITLEYED